MWKIHSWPHADFKDVHANFVERERELAGGFKVRVAAANVNNKALLPALFELGEAFDKYVLAKKVPVIGSAEFQQDVPVMRVKVFAIKALETLPVQIFRFLRPLR